MKSFENRHSQESQKILPSDVRYALQYKEGILDKNDIENLAMSNFENEAMYMTLKGLRHNLTQHQELMSKYVSSIQERGDDEVINKKVLRDLLEQELKQYQTLEVDGVKLAQISRQGFDFWQEKFRDIAGKLSIDNREVFLLAHATLLGLDSFIKAFSQKQKDFHIIVPSWIEEKNPIIGYTVSFANQKGKVELLYKNDFNGNNAVLIDDTINTGTTMTSIKQYWANSNFTVPEAITIAGNKA